MAECLEDLDLDFDFNIDLNFHNRIPCNKMALQLIDLAEKEGFSDLDISDTQFIDGILFQRIERLEKVKRIKINNTNITTLTHCPPNIEELIIKKGNIHIANFILIAQLIKKITIINNKIKTVINVNLLSNLVFLDLSQNELTEIPLLPENLLVFIATHNKIKQITNLNSKLIDVNLSNNLITDMINIPHQIESINISRNNIKIVDLSSFKQLKVFKAYNNSIDLIIGPISENIEVIDIFNNKLSEIPDIGLKIKEIDISNNDLKILPKFGTGILERIDITKNPLLKLSDNEIQMLLDINIINKSLIVICDQFDMPYDKEIPILSSLSSSSSFDIFDNDDDNDDINDINIENQINGETSMIHFDILELLNRNKHKQERSSPKSSKLHKSLSIDREIIIHKRRTYEL